MRILFYIGFIAIDDECFIVKFYTLSHDTLIDDFTSLDRIILHDIMTIQVLVNDTVAVARGRGESSSFMSSPMEARKMAGFHIP